MSDSALDSRTCPKCSAVLPADAAEGLCPRCLMAEAMQPTGPKKAWEPPTAAELGELLPEYDIEKLLGRGGMGAVYKGRQKSLDRAVAIKILSSTLDESDQGFAERFKNEARALGKLKHPGIVGVYDFGTAADGLLYIVMEYIDGTDVAKMIAQKGRLHTDHAMAITAHVCDALAYAHSQGIIHRDIKPANIMVGYDGVVQVADFGLAKMTHSQNSGLTQSGMAMGTLHYMAPESLMLGTSVDHRADIYAVGVMLYQMLTGKLPQGLFAMPSLQIKGLDPRYDGIIGKALMEDRDVRYQSITEMRMGLDEILTQPVVKAEASAGKTPAALNTQARPKRSAAADEKLVVLQNDEHAVKRSFNWPWAVLIVLLALGVWEYLRKRPEVTPPSDTSVAKSVPAVTPPVVASAPAVSATPTTASAPSTSAPPVPAPPAAIPVTATKEQPFVNSLGMKFVLVPGTKVQFCIHETRYQDYAAYAEASPGVDGSWKDQSSDGYALEDKKEQHPVWKVSWEDAQKFCAWLSQKEGKTYRLPTDEEWSYAVGIGRDEKRTKGTLPSQVMQVPNEFPWGGDFPPKTKDQAGNYSDASRKTKAPGPDGQYFDNYDDGFPTTAPAMSFKPNKLGLYDLGGNVWEWCEDWYDNAQKTRVLRGAAWGNWERDHMLSSHRRHLMPDSRDFGLGFRLVLELSADTAKSTVTAKMSDVLGDPPNTTRRVIDLIPLVDLPRDTMKGSWLPAADGLLAPPVSDSSSDQIQWPHAIQTAEFDYEVEFSFTEGKATGLSMSFPAAGRRIGWLMNLFKTTANPYYGFPNLDGQVAVGSKEARINRGGLLSADKRHHAKVLVRQSSLTGVLNGEILVHWEGDLKRFKSGTTAKLRDPLFPVLSVDEGGAIIHKATVTEFVPKNALPTTPASSAVSPAANAAPQLLPGGPTTWTDIKGRSITGTFKAMAGDNVLLEIAGKVQPVALNTLSAASQKLARDLAQPASAASPTSIPPTPAQEQEVEIAPGVKMTFVWCPPGSVPRQKANQLNEMEVVGTVFSLTKGFWIGKYEVTQEQWAAVIGSNPSTFKGKTLPVEMVDWNQANAFLTKVGKGFRLPTEAEWEYACRAGSLTKYCFGNDVARLADYAWYGDDKGQTHPVGQKKPNDWGIHDMHGNVWEWCQDRKGEDYWDEGYKGSRIDPSGPVSGGDRVNRGGCWKFDADASRSAQRGWVPQGGWLLNYLGFRVALSSIE